jgi:hypothetical protein
MINSYIELALEAEPHERDAMLDRKAPLFVRVKLAAKVLKANLFLSRNDDDRMNYVSHRPALLDA